MAWHISCAHYSFMADGCKRYRVSMTVVQFELPLGQSMHGIGRLLEVGSDLFKTFCLTYQE